MLNGLDLFSGIGGIALALAPWVRPVAYCEIDRYAQGVILSQMGAGRLPVAPIWDDVQTLRTEQITGKRIGDMSILPHGYFHDDGQSIDIITGGFPCQDISVAGNGAGLAGERSGLFKEIVRLAGELRPAFIFLENVPAITTRGGRDVVGAITALGYDCRWCIISAKSVGARHKRERWFLLAHTRGERCQECNPTTGGGIEGFYPWTVGSDGHYWESESRMVRVLDGVSNRLDRIKGLGNAVVPLQARTAFKILMGIVQ